MNAQAALGLASGYGWRQGRSADRGLLLRFLQWGYGELFPERPDFAHLEATVARYWGGPLWWVEAAAEATPAACLWLGDAIDQSCGERYTHIFLLYVCPAHRRRGIGSALMQRAQARAAARGDRQLGLQVFQRDGGALAFYRHWGFQPQSLFAVKPLAGA